MYIAGGLQLNLDRRRMYINFTVFAVNFNLNLVTVSSRVEFYLYPTVGTVLIHSVKPELTE